MSIYARETHQIYNLNQIDFLKKNKNYKNFNLFHPYKFLIFQGPSIVAKIYKYISNDSTEYIPETKTNIGLSMILMDLDIKNISISSSLESDLKLKILSLGEKKKVKIYFSEKFNFVSQL